MGPQMNAQRSAEAAALVRAHAEEQIGPLAFRLRGVDLEVAAEGTLAVYAGMHGLDHAWVPEGRRFADLRLIAMDMDSTLITIECIDEIGDAIGIKDRIAEITAQAMRGEIDYPESLRRRVAMLAGLDVGALANVYHQKLRLSPGAEILVDAAKRRGIRLLLVSGGFTYFTDRLKDRLGLDHTASNVLEIEAGRLTGRVIGDIVDAQGKAARLRSLAQSMGLAREQVLAIGDGANDLAMMAEAGVSVAYRAKPVVKARATHALDHMGLDGVLHLYE
ncbi:MAG: phosphoserine phosphatase SerB [Betaproteobacteria bacterium]|nr:phosphoserine phosphatase SerB [Betaproteobacteria bacterium]